MGSHETESQGFTDNTGALMNSAFSPSQGGETEGGSVKSSTTTWYALSSFESTSEIGASDDASASIFS